MKHILVKYFVGFVMSLLSVGIANTQPVSLFVNTVDSIDINKVLILKKQFATKSLCINYVEQLPTILKAKGFISASLDSVAEIGTTIRAFLYTGKLYTWNNLSLPTEIKFLMDASTKDYSNLPEIILNYYENSGYPFAKVGFDSVVINEKNEITATILVDKGIKYKIDSIRVYGNVNINTQFLQHYLKITNGSAYNKEKLEKVNSLINQLGFLSSTKNSDVLMLNTGSILNLYLQPKNINKFDAIVGFLPNNQQNDGKLLFTVDAKISLFNAFANGEKIFLNWQQIQPQSPRIDIGFSKPYIFNSDVGLDLNFNLYKRDSLYLNIGTDIGLNYKISNKKSFKIFISSLSTRLIQPDTLFIINNKKLPPVLDVGINNLGVEYNYDNTKGTSVNKIGGTEIKLYGGFGQKKINRNTTITSIKSGSYNYSSLYDSLATNTYQLKLKIMAAKFFRASKLSVIKLSANYGIIQTKDYLQNEMFQIGGFKLLRGFDEENIFTNQYFVGSLEYRYLIAANSYFFAFTDGGFTQNNNTQNKYNYWGSGVGLAFETKQGVLNISFAAGKRNDLPFNLRETKIHIGLVSGF